MKKSFKIILLAIVIVISLKTNVVEAATPLVCIYKGGTQNSPTMLIQDSNGNFSVKINYYGDYTDVNDTDWYAASEDHEYTLKFDDTKKYKNSELTGCPQYLQHSSIYKLAFHDSKGAFRLDYKLYEEYNLELDSNNYKQSFEGNYVDEISKYDWIGQCDYYDEDGTEKTTLYFNRDRMIIAENSSLIYKTSTDFSLNELLEVYDTTKSCPVLHAKNTCYANIGNTFCYVNYSLEKDFSHSDTDAPGSSSVIDSSNDPETPKIDETPIDGCTSLLGEPDTKGTPAWYLSLIFSIMRYVAIVLLIVLTIMDFVGAIASQDNDILKKATSKLLKRAIMCVIIFLLPTFIDFVLQFIHDTSVSECIKVNI